MRRIHLTKEEGQSLMHFAAIVLALVLFVALALDTGYAFSIRRRLQNAADAAALAAAREICLGSNTSKVTTVANGYLTMNNAEAIGVNGSSILFSGQDNAHIQVDARGPAETILGNMLNMGPMTVAATAKGACGATSSVCGAWPVAFDFNIFASLPCGRTIAVWDADQENQQVTCYDKSGVQQNICYCYDCKQSGKGIDDFVALGSLSRGWLDYASPTNPIYEDKCTASGCGTSELSCRLLNNGGGRISAPLCVAGLSGVKSSMKTDVNARAGEIVSIALFDGINCGTSNNCTAKAAQSFHVQAFGCVKVVGWVSLSLPLKPGMVKDPKSYPSTLKTNTIMVTKECGSQCISACGATNGDPAEPWRVRSASLID